MALSATIIKAQINIADMDRHYYQEHTFTLAQHPSETNERLMLRLLAFCLQAHEHLTFTKGLSTDDEPDLWQKSLTDEIELWIDLGQPSEKRIRKACGRAKQVMIYSYGGNAAEKWWQQIQGQLERFEHLSVYAIPADASKDLAAFVGRTMDLQVNIQDGEITLLDGDKSLTIQPQFLSCIAN